jgi:hypothetical protein
MEFGLSLRTLTNFYRCSIESILLGCITVWYSNCATFNRKVFQRVVRSAQRITGGQLPAVQDTNSTLMSQEGQKDHQGQPPPEPLPVHPITIQKARSVQVYQNWDRETEKQLFFLKAIRPLNSNH